MAPHLLVLLRQLLLLLGPTARLGGGVALRITVALHLDVWTTRRLGAKLGKAKASCDVCETSPRARVCEQGGSEGGSEGSRGARLEQNC